MAHTWKVIATNIGRQRNVAIRAGAHEIGRSPQVVELRRAERLHNPGTGFRGPATIEQPCCRKASRVVGVIRPPIDTVTAGFIHSGRSTGSRESDVHRQHSNRDIRIAAVEDDAPGFILIESQMNEASQEGPGLGVALADRRIDLSANNIRSAGIVLRAVPQVGDQIASGREPDSMDLRILCRVHELVQVSGIESILKTNLPRIRCSGKWVPRAIREGPVCTAQRDHPAVFRRTASQRGPGSIETGRISGSRNAAAKYRQRVCFRSHVSEAGEHRSGDARPIGILRYRHYQRLHAISRREISLPATGDNHMALSPGVGRESPARQIDAPAIRHEVDQHTTGFGQIRWRDDGKRRHVFHHPARVARCKLEIGDDGVQWKPRVEFSIGMASEFLISVGPERLRAFDDEARDSGVYRDGQRKDHHGHECGPEEWNVHGCLLRLAVDSIRLVILSCLLLLVGARLAPHRNS